MRPLPLTHATQDVETNVAGRFSPPVGTVRASVLQGLPAILEQHGVKGAPVFCAFGVSPPTREITDERIPFRALGSLLDYCSRLTRCGHVGLLAAQGFELAHAGILGEIARSSPTVGRALFEINARRHLHDNAAIGMVRRLDRKRVAFAYSMLDGRAPGAGQITDGAVAMMYRALRELAGPGWLPERVMLSRRRPRDVMPYRRLFGTDVKFDSDVTEIVFDDHWLEHPVASADAERYRALTAGIDAGQPQDEPGLPTQVRFVVCSQLLAGDASVQQVARLLGYSRRTLFRRLDAHGTSFRELSDDVRFNLALHLLRNTSLPVATIAETLCYSDGSSFSRAFHRWSGISAREFRCASRAGSHVNLRGSSRVLPRTQRAPAPLENFVM